MLMSMTAAHRKTMEDLFAGGVDVRAELIDGAIVPKSEAGAEHGFAQGKLYAWAMRRFDRGVGGRWPGGWWLIPEQHVRYSPWHVYCHDIAGWRRDRVPAKPTGVMTIRPDWACEVLSPGHEKRDLVDKLATLHTAGVPGYWVIDPVERMILAYDHRPDGYLVRTIPAGEVLRAEPFDAAELRTAVIFGDEDDED
jgi:Uma2 family endonuclease